MTTLTNNQNEQLFTDLTPQEAAVIEGGKDTHKFALYKIECIQARADGGNDPDDLYIKIGGVQYSQPSPMKRGSKLSYWGNPKKRNFAGNGITVHLFDHDRGSPDQRVGRRHFENRSTGGFKTTRVRGHGSVYDMTYAVWSL